MLTDRQKELVEETLDNFDFHKAHKLFKRMNWKYASSPEVPTPHELRKAAKRTLETGFESYNREEDNIGYSSSGRFQALCFKEEVELSLIYDSSIVYFGE